MRAKHQQQSPVLGSSSEAYAITLDLSHEEAESLLQLLRPFTVLPASDDDFPTYRTRFFVYDRLRKLARKRSSMESAA